MSSLHGVAAAACIALLLLSCGSDEDREGTGGAGASSSGGGATPASACGNDQTDAGEACDGADLNGYSCATVAAALTGGSLACRADCLGYDISACEAAGQTITVATCEQADVQAAIDSASDGDVVSVPAGQCTWTSPAGCDGRTDCAPVHISQKGITLAGAGVGNTVITSAVPEGWQYSTIFVDGEEDKPARVTGFTFNEVIAPAISVNGSVKNFRIDHCDVHPVAGQAIVAVEVTGSAYGVVDHCTFDVAEVLVLHDEDEAFARPLTLGTANAVYIEDSTYTNAGEINDVVDGRSGARFVFRHNEITNLELHCHGIEGGGSRGTYSYELYNNTGICDGATNCYRMAYLRGGTGAVFDNTWVGAWSDSGLQVVHQCAYLDSCSGFKECTRYPCNDQIGRTTDHNLDGTQDLVPLFEWGNTIDGTDVDLVVQDWYHAEVAIYVQENRDFYNDTVEQDEQTGAYRATFTDDDGSSREWLYSPYVHPHPLVQIDDELSGR